MPSFRSNIVLEALVARFREEGEKLYSVASGASLGSLWDKSLGVPKGTSSGLARTIVRKRESHCHVDSARKRHNDADLIIQKVRHTLDKLCFLLKNNDVQVKKFTLTIKYSDNKKSQKTVALPQCEVPRYDYEYWDEELLQRVKGQLVMRTKTSLLAIAFNNHFQARLWECDSCVFVRE